MSKQKPICVQNMFFQCSELVVFMYWTSKSMNNHLSYCGLVNPRISASDIDLPVPKGQLISKAIYGVLDSPKKPTKKI